jgi:hypothetical protein
MNAAINQLAHAITDSTRGICFSKGTRVNFGTPPTVVAHCSGSGSPTAWEEYALVTYPPYVQSVVNCCPGSAYLWHYVKEASPWVVVIVIQHHLWHCWHTDAGLGNPLKLHTNQRMILERWS